MEKHPITYTELKNNVIVATVLRARTNTATPEETIYKKIDERGWRIEDPKVYNSIIDWLRQHVTDPHLKGIAFEVSQNWEGKHKLKELLKGFAEEDNPDLFVFKEK